jgi:hypothetical protein
MFIYRSRFLTRGEVWFDEEPAGAAVDWIYHRQRSSPLAHYRWQHFYTRLIDLRKGSGELLAEIEDKTRRKVTEAQAKDRLRCERSDARDPKLMDAVEQMWNEFARAQNTPLFERDWLDRMREAGRLDLTAAKNPQGQVLAYHLVFLTPARARQILAISPHRAVPDVAWRGAVSRANCFIHWQNFLAFKTQGIPCFDFGGWYTGSSNIQFLGINRFKKSFGGKVVLEYDCEQPLTVRGWILLTAAQILARIKQGRTPTSAVRECADAATQPAEPDLKPVYH